MQPRWHRCSATNTNPGRSRNGLSTISAIFLPLCIFMELNVLMSLVITGGLNVYPKEIELLIDELDGVLESAVIGVPHPDFGDSQHAAAASLAGYSHHRRIGLSGISLGDLVCARRPARNAV